MPVTFKRASPYQDDEMNLPVKDVAEAIPYYETILGFKVLSRSDVPCKSVVLGRDDIKIGLAENGGDPESEGCFFEVDDVEAAFAELRSNGLDREDPGYDVQQHGDTLYRLFFLIAPDRLCYCIGQPQDSN